MDDLGKNKARPASRACVVQCHNAGLFSLINKVVVCADFYEQVHVDFSQGHRCLYAPAGVNLWNELFEPTEPLTGKFDAILDYPDFSMTAQAASLLYDSGDEWRANPHANWQRFRVRPELVARADAFVHEHWIGRDVVAAMIRATTHSCEQATNRTQALEEYAVAFERERKTGSVLYVMAGDEESLRWFNERFTVTFLPDTKRSATREIDRHLHESQTIEDARQCLVEVLIASRARALIHPVSNMATAALYINPALKSVYLR